MGKDVKKKFTVSLDIDMKDVKKEFKATVGNIQDALANLGNAADKVGYFKDLVSYIGQIDAALTTLRDKNKDAFDNMFDGLDENLRKQLEGLFGTSGAVANQFSVLYDKMNTLTPKSGIKELRKFAKEIDSLFKSIGVDSPFEDIDKQFFGKANAQHIQLLTDALNSFSTVWDGVNDKVKQGFGFGKSSGDSINPSKTINKISKEVQDEIDTLKKQQKEIQEIVDVLNNPNNVNVKLSKKSNEQVEQLKALKQAFLDATVVKQQFETSNMTGSDAYLTAVADYVKAAAELKSAFESDDLKDPAMNWVNASGLNELNDADKVLGDFLKQNKATMTKIQNMYSDKTSGINNQIEFLLKPYDVLKEKMQEYVKLQDIAQNDDRLSDDDQDKLWNEVDAISKYLVSLDMVGDKAGKIKQILHDVDFNGLQVNDAIEQLCNLLDVKIPDAAKKAEDALESINNGSPVVNSTSSDANNNANVIVENANKTISAIDYAKKELVKAWQDYYLAVEDAKNSGIDVLNDDSTEMEAALDSAYTMLDKWGVNPSQKMLLTNTASKILFDELNFDDIEQFVNDQFDYLRSVDNKVQVSLDVVPAKTDEVQDDINDAVINAVKDAVSFDKQSAYENAKIEIGKFLKSSTGDMRKYGAFSTLYNQIHSVQNEATAEDIAHNVFLDGNGEFIAIENVVRLIQDIEEKYGENLESVKNYLQNLYTNIDFTSKAKHVELSATGSIDSNSLQLTENQVDDVLGSFKNLVDYISQSGSTPGKFFDKLESGAQNVDNELNEILQSLQLIDSSGNINLESIKSGFTNKGGFVSDQYTMIARPDWYLPKIESLQPMLAEAQQAGAKIGAIVDIIEDKANGLIYEVQNTVPGTAAFSHHNYSVNQSALNATEDQIADLVNTLQVLQQKGLFVDWGGDNVLYDENKGFSIIDLGNKGGKSHTVSKQNSMQENLDRLVSEMSKFDKSVIKSKFVDNLYKMANDSGNNVVNPYSTVSNTSNKQHKEVQNAVSKVTASVNAEKNAHKQNEEAVNAENLALQAQIDLKKKAQSMKWEAFALDESTIDLKKQVGFQTLSDMEKFWKQANYEKEIDWHEISKHDARKIFDKKLPQGLAYDWYGPGKFNVKDKLENEILADDEVRNAALNYLYHLYKENVPLSDKDPNVKTFEDFLNTEFTVYRGDDAPLIYGDESKLSFSFKKSTAKGFDSNTGIAKIIPKETIGNAGSIHEGEVETFVSSYKTSWFKQTGETFEDFYNKQTKEMQDEINIGLINLEKQRVQDILGSDFTKLAHKAGKTQEFKNNILQKFQQGVVPENLDDAGNGDLSDQFASAYNGLSDIGKKLAAYYVAMDAISATLPDQFSIDGWKESSKAIVGKDANLYNTVLNDPTGTKRHVASLTGELGFNLFDKSEQEIKAETEALQQNTQAAQDNAQAKNALGNAKLNYQDIEQQLYNTVMAADNDKFSVLAPIYHALNDVDNTSKDVIEDGLYQVGITGEVLPISDLISTINNVEQKYGENLGYVKDYLQQVYGQLDIDGTQIKQAQDNSKYINIKDKLSQIIWDTNTSYEKADGLNAISYELDDVEDSSKDMTDNGMYMHKLTGELVPIADLTDMIDDFEQKYNEDLSYVKDYLKQVFNGLDFGSAAKDFDITDYAEFDKVNGQLFDISKYAFGEKYDQLSEIQDAVYEIYETAISDHSSDLDFGSFLKYDGEVVSADYLYAQIKDVEQKYGENLGFVKDYLDQMFKNYHAKVDDALNAANASLPDTSDVINELYSINFGIDLDKMTVVSDLINAVDSIKNTDQNLLDGGMYQNGLTGEIVDANVLYELVDKLEYKYGENLSNVKDYLNKVFAKWDKDFIPEFELELDDIELPDEDIDYKTVNSKLAELKMYTNAFDKSYALSEIQAMLYDVETNTDDDDISKGKYFDSSKFEHIDWSEISKCVSDFEAEYLENLDYVHNYLKQVFLSAADQMGEITVEFDDDEIIDYSDPENHTNEYDKIYWKLEALIDGSNSEKLEAIAALQSKIVDINYDVKSNPRIIEQGKFLDSFTLEEIDWAEVSDLVSDFEVQYGENLDYIHDYLKKVFAKQHEELDQLFSGADVSFAENNEFSSKQYNIKDYEDIYGTQSKRAQDAINDLAEFYQFYESMKSKINSDPIEFVWDTPMGSEVCDVLDIIDELKVKMQEVQEIIDTQDLGDYEAQKKVFELQSEAVGLQNKLRGAKLPDGGDSLLDYQNTFFLSEDEAKWMQSIIQGEDIYDIYQNLIDLNLSAHKTVYDLADSNLKSMMDNDLSGIFNQYLLQLADKLSAQQKATPKNKHKKSLSSDVSDHEQDQSKQPGTPDAQFDSNDIHGQDYALETTLQKTNSILGDILSATTDNESDKQSIDALNDAVTELNKVASGIVEHQKAQKTDTSAAMARIADPVQYKQISDIAMSSVDQLGSEVQIKGLKAIANGLVSVEGAFKNANDEWEGFTVKVNEANKAVDLATNKQSAFAKALNKVQENADDIDTNAKKYDKSEVEARAQKHLDYYTQQGKNATVQFKDSGRYTITILEEIDGLTKQIFQTFDENDDKIERTTATVSNSQKVKLENLKKLIDAGVIDNTVGDHDVVYKQYKNAVDELEKMNALYKAQDNLSNEEILNWNAQIKLVQQLGTAVEKLINQRKNAVLSDVFKSERDKKLSKFDLDKAELQNDINIPDSFNRRIDDSRKAIENAMDNDSLKIAINNWEALKNEIKQTATEQDLYIKKANSAKSANAKPDKFTKDLDKQKTDFAKYKNDVQNALGVTDDLRNKLLQLETDLNAVGDVDGLNAWVQQLKNVKTEILNAQKVFKASQIAVSSDIVGKANSKFKELNFKANDNNLTQEQEEVVNKRKELLQQIKEYNIKVNSGQKAEIDGIIAIRDELYKLIDAYKHKYNITSGGNVKKGKAYGLNQLQTFTAKYNSLLSGASDVGLNDQSAVVSNLVNAYKKLQAAQSAFVAGEDLTSDVGKKKVEAFKAAQLACNKYAQDLNKVVASSKKLASESVASDSLAEDFVDSIDGRKAALTDFVRTMYGANASIEGFDKAFNELNFTVKNGDGTFTKMTATINDARTAINATAGATGEITSKFKSFINELSGKFKSIGAYFVASFGWQEIWQQLRQGVEYVREIDSALTELKKVTSETDATYDRFLKSMSKTAGTVGSTVSELTTMAADWARLGYSIEESAKLAESTAILLNVSEFQDATAASEALISTMQAFQYTAKDSQHVVDILNEVKVTCLRV